MRMIAEPIGRFWQGRFRMVRLCDEAALLACAVFGDSLRYFWRSDCQVERNEGPPSEDYRFG
jgi:hypothetical protein